MNILFLRRALAVSAASGLVTVSGFVAAVPADAASYHYANCTKLHHAFKHGVGKKGAHDHVSGSSKPVTTFKRSTKIYKAAIKYNSRLDADHDGVACEKR